ncbi:MAG: type II toxin-antitoxin system RelE/ParE family toxin [Acidimicrobiales bacterium]
MSGDAESYELRATGPAQRQLERLPEGTAAAIVEFMLSALVENPHRVGGRLQRELAGLYSARRGAYRVVYEIDEGQGVVVVLRVDHRSRIYRSR